MASCPSAALNTCSIFIVRTASVLTAMAQDLHTQATMDDNKHGTEIASYRVLRVEIVRGTDLVQYSRYKDDIQLVS